MKTLRIFFWVGIVLFTIALFIALAKGDYDAAIWISLCVLYHIMGWSHRKHIDEQKRLIDKWEELTVEYKEVADRAIAEVQRAYSTAFYLAMLMGIDNDTAE